MSMRIALDREHGTATPTSDGNRPRERGWVRAMWACLSIVFTLALAGCGSNTTSADAGAAVDAAPFVPNTNSGSSCYVIWTLYPGAVDGCGIGVRGLVGSELTASYDVTTGAFALGSNGGLGSGVIRGNVADLASTTTASNASGSCSWQQTDSASLTMIADGELTVSVTQTESNFAATCASAPAGGQCTSTWQWALGIDNGRSSPACQGVLDGGQDGEHGLDGGLDVGEDEGLDGGLNGGIDAGLDEGLNGGLEAGEDGQSGQ